MSEADLFDITDPETALAARRIYKRELAEEMARASDGLRQLLGVVEELRLQKIAAWGKHPPRKRVRSSRKARMRASKATVSRRRRRLRHGSAGKI